MRRISQLVAALAVLLSLSAVPAGAEHEGTAPSETVFDDSMYTDPCDPAVYPDWDTDPFCNPQLTTGTTIGDSTIDDGTFTDPCDPAVYPDWDTDPFCNPLLTTPTTMPGPLRTSTPAPRSAVEDVPLVELDPNEATEVSASRMLLAIDAIAELGGFERATMAADASLLRDIRTTVPSDGLDETGYEDELERFVLDFVPYLVMLEDRGIVVSEDLWTAALDLEDVLFSEFDPDSSDPGDSALLDPAPWLYGLADLLVRGATSSTTPTPDVDQAAIRELLTTFAVAPTPTTTTTEVSSPVEDEAAPDALALETVAADTTSEFPIFPVTVAGVVLIVGGSLALLRRRRRPTPPVERDIFRPDHGATRGSPQTKVTDLLDASRRMSATLDVSAIAAIALEEAKRIVGAEGGLVVRRSPEGLVAVGCSPVHLFEPARVDESGLPRVVETGRAMAAVGTEEPLLMELPMAMGSVPIVADGVVTGAIMVVRDASLPFDRDDLDALEMLAPLVGSALAVAQTHESAKELVDVEPLTGLHNRRRLDLDLASISTDDEVAYLMVDIDHFKNFNDTNGHAAGDEALRQVSAILQASVRPNDFVYRYGGEEFCVLLPGATAPDALTIAERARAAVEAAEIPGMEHQPGGRVTISVGVSDSAFDGPDMLVERADAALYESKRNGRNQVTVSS